MIEDITLFVRIRDARDIRAFDTLFRRWYPVLVSYACCFVDRDDAENIVQDIMAALWENSAKIRLERSVSSYLMTSVKNRCLNLINRGVVNGKYVSSMKMMAIEESLPSDYIQYQELDVLFNKALDGLPDVQKSTFAKNRFQDKTYAEIAQEDGVSIKTVEYRMSMALKALRAALSDFIE